MLIDISFFFLFTSLAKTYVKIIKNWQRKWYGHKNCFIYLTLPPNECPIIPNLFQPSWILTIELLTHFLHYFIPIFKDTYCFMLFVNTPNFQTFCLLQSWKSWLTCKMTRWIVATCSTSWYIRPAILFLRHRVILKKKCFLLKVPHFYLPSLRAIVCHWSP